MLTLYFLVKVLFMLAPPERFELPSTWFEAKHSNPLSYRGIILVGPERFELSTNGLKVRCSTTELRSYKMVPSLGIEPGTRSFYNW